MSDNNSETSTTTNEEMWDEGDYLISFGYFQSNPQLENLDVYDLTSLTLLQSGMMKALEDINQKIEDYVNKNMKVA